MAVYYLNIDENEDLDPIEIEDWCETYNDKAHVIFFGLDISSAESIENDLSVLIRDFEDGIDICKALIDSFSRREHASDTYLRNVFSWSKSPNYAVIIKNHTMFELAMNLYKEDSDEIYYMGQGWNVQSNILDDITSREQFFIKVAGHYLEKFSLEKTIDLVEDKKIAKFKI